MAEATIQSSGVVANDSNWLSEEDSLVGFRGDVEFTGMFSHVEVKKSFIKPDIDPKQVKQITQLIVILAVVFAGYVYLWPMVQSYIENMNKGSAVTEIVPSTQVNRESVSVTEVEEAPAPSSSFVSTLPKPAYTTNRSISPVEEGLWISELEHPYTFRRFKMVYEARRQLLAGSESFFIKALDEQKFWTRMQAIFALAEMGAEVSSEHVQRAIGNARPYLQKNYFKRFRETSTEGERYVMSIAMYFVTEPAQAVIGDILAPYQK